MRDIRQGICPLCGHQEIIKSPQTSGFVQGMLYNPEVYAIWKRDPKTREGLLWVYTCRSCGYCATFAQDPLRVPIGDKYKNSLIKGPGGSAGGNPNRRRLPTTHAAIYLGDEAIEQDWPTGQTHQVIWREAFEVILHRAPPTPGPTADVHVRLQQRRDGELFQVLLTLCLTDSPRIQALSIWVAFLPRLEGSDAHKVLNLIKNHSSAHGLRLEI